MREVRVLSTRLSDELWLAREKACWKFWHSMTPEEKDVLLRTVESEMRRLAENVSNWLPASVVKTNGTIVVELVLTVDELGVMAHEGKVLTEQEKAEAQSVIADLSMMVKNLENND